MNKRFYLIAGSFALLCILASVWLSYEASRLEDRLRDIDRQSQITRLMELSLPRLDARLQQLLDAEAAKTGTAMPNFAFANYRAPHAQRAAFNKGFFLLSPAGLFYPREARDFGNWLEGKTLIVDTMRRKAYNPHAPLFDPLQESRFDAASQVPVFAVYQVDETDFSKPIKVMEKPSAYFAWHGDGELIYMRSIRTSHGHAAQGFVIDVEALSQQLLPLVEPRLLSPSIRLTPNNEKGNLPPLPLELLAGSRIDLPDTQLRSEALRGTLFTAWGISIGSIILIASLMWVYSLIERRRSDFVSAVTHELRTPLTSFTLYTEMLAENKDLPAETVEKYHEKLHRESLRLNHLVENVLAYARLSRGKIRGRQDLGLCGVLLPELFAKIGKPLRAAGFHYQYTLDKRCHHVQLRTDLLTLEQALTNLSDNAIKYASRPQASVQIHVLQTTRELHIRFSDKGPGIEEEREKQLFAPFQRSAEAQKGKQAGIGLGLALSRDLLRSIGGELRYERTRSEVTGSTFLVILPLT